MSKLYVMTEVRINAGKLDDFKALSKVFYDLVVEKDTGTLMYEFFLDEAQGTCNVLEVYESSEALLAHLGNVGHEFGNLLAIAQLSITVLGKPSAAVVQATAALAPRIFPEFVQGLDYVPA